VPHFDREAHERAQRRGDERRAHRIARQRGVNIDQPESPNTMSFLGVAAILAAVVMGPFLISGMWHRGDSGGKPGERDRQNGGGGGKNKEGKGR